MCFCNVFLLAGTATDACAWRSDFAQAHEQPDYPGIRKHFIERTAKDGGTITMYYPETGNAAVDEAILAVITTELNSFEKDSSEDSTKNPAIILPKVRISGAPFQAITLSTDHRPLHWGLSSLFAQNTARDSASATSTILISALWMAGC